MNVTATLLILSILCFLVVEGRLFERCKENSQCDFGECCSRRRCKPRIAPGYRCNIFRMLIGHQCPCAPGYSCRFRSTHSRRRTCKPMNHKVIHHEIHETTVVE